jgi:hypothetical protein
MQTMSGRSRLETTRHEQQLMNRKLCKIANVTDGSLLEVLVTVDLVSLKESVHRFVAALALLLFCVDSHFVLFLVG